MWFLAALVPGSVPMPPDTPIPCLVCTAPATAPALTFAGTVQYAQGDRLRVFNGRTHQTMGFIVPASFRGVTSSDGRIKDAPLSRVPLGLLARVTYRTVADRRVVSHVLLLTINQCRALVAAEGLSARAADCPD